MWTVPKQVTKCPQWSWHRKDLGDTACISCQVTWARREISHCSWWATAKTARNVACHRDVHEKSIEGGFMLWWFYWFKASNWDFPLQTSHFGINPFQETPKWFGDLICHRRTLHFTSVHVNSAGEVLEAKSLAYQRAYERPGGSRCVTLNDEFGYFWGIRHGSTWWTPHEISLRPPFRMTRPSPNMSNTFCLLLWIISSVGGIACDRWSRRVHSHLLPRAHFSQILRISR